MLTKEVIQILNKVSQSLPEGSENKFLLSFIIEDLERERKTSNYLLVTSDGLVIGALS